VVAILAAVLAGLGLKGIDWARDRILADPQILQDHAARAWNTFNAAAVPVLQEFDRIAMGIDQFINGLNGDGVPGARDTQALDHLKTECEALEARIPNIPAENGEIQAIRTHLTAAQSFQLQILTALREFSATGNPASIDGPRGFHASVDAYRKEFQTIGSLRDAYFKAHDLHVVPKTH
jgi:hypothetical protein